jgi:hypothetical protein
VLWKSTLILYRPIGLKELELIAASNYAVFPPRLPEQPIFYPVLDSEYAEQIARDWNAVVSPYAGFVTRFKVDDTFAEKYEIHTVGGRIHRELWVPAEDLEEFNGHITGKIEIVTAYYGKGFSHAVNPLTNLPENLPE